MRFSKSCGMGLSQNCFVMLRDHSSMRDTQITHPQSVIFLHNLHISRGFLGGKILTNPLLTVSVRVLYQTFSIQPFPMVPYMYVSPKYDFCIYAQLAPHCYNLIHIFTICCTLLRFAPRFFPIFFLFTLCLQKCGANCKVWIHYKSVEQFTKELK